MDVSVLEVVAVGSAAVLAAVFVVAAVAKWRSQPETASDFASLGLPAPSLWARVVPVLELLTAGLLVINPGWGGVAAFGLLAAFTATLAVVLHSGRVASCACFGGTSTAPVSSRHLLRNGGLLILALLAATFSGWTWSLL